MTTLMPEGENLRRAVKWVSEQTKNGSKKPVQVLVNEASIQFDLTPKDSQSLLKLLMDQNKAS